MPACRDPGISSLSIALLLWTVLFLAPIGHAGAQEIGGPSDTEGGVLPVGLHPGNLRCFLAGGVLIPTDDTLDDVYDALTRWDLGLTLDVGYGLRLLASLGTASADGDPYGELPTFDGGARSRVEAVPVRLGLQGDLLRHPRHRLLLGGGPELIRVQETLPVGDTQTTGHAWGGGLWLALSHEFVLKGRLPRAVGLDLGWSASGADPHPGVDLGGWSLRLMLILDP